MTGKPLRILVVDDEALIRWSLSEILGRQGHKVVGCLTHGGGDVFRGESQRMLAWSTDSYSFTCPFCGSPLGCA